MTTPTDSSNRYIFETFTDRERLYTQFEIFKDDINKKLREALELGQLSTDPATANWRFLDAGCGEGLYSSEILTNYPQVEIVGLDIDQEAITTATMFVGPRGNAHFFVHNLTEPLPATFSTADGKVSGRGFDVIMALLVLIHTKPPEKSLANLVNALKPGGVIMILDSITEWTNFPHPSLITLSQVMIEAGNKMAHFDFGERHVEAFEQVGLQSINSAPFIQPMGGTSRAGQLMLSHTMATLEAARIGIVERAKVISGSEFDRHVNKVKTESTTDQEGQLRFVLTIAQKPLENR